MSSKANTNSKIKPRKYKIKGRFGKQLKKDLIKKIKELDITKGMYIGASSHLNETYKRHQRDINRKHLKYMSVLYKTSSINVARKIERFLIKKYKNYWNNDNIQDGGEGLSEFQKTYSIYVMTKAKN